MKAWIGIDPGESGGIAVVGDGIKPWAVKMPETERDIWDTIRALKSWSDREAIARLEFVAARPGQSAPAMWKFAGSYWGLRMALTAAEIPFSTVTPKSWQKEMQCLTGGDKNVSKARAQQLFPELKITHAIADALLIAEWARRTAK